MKTMKTIIMTTALFILSPLTVWAHSELGRVSIPNDAVDIRIESFSTEKTPVTREPGYLLSLYMTSMTEGDCDPTAPAGYAGSCTEPRDNIKFVHLKASQLGNVPKLSHWTSNKKIANKLFQLAVEKTDSETWLVVLAR